MESEKIIMAVKADALFGDEYFEGYMPAGKIDYASRILSGHGYMQRILAEEDPSCKQPIVYSLLVNPFIKKVFAYQRSDKDERYDEKTLQGRWSLGIGGHIEMTDADGGDPILSGMRRELWQEVQFGGIPRTEFLGCLNHDRSHVGMTHFGLLFVVETDSRIIIPKDPEIDKGKLMGIEELERMCSSPDFEVEEWSIFSMAPLKSYLNRL